MPKKKNTSKREYYVGFNEDGYTKKEAEAAVLEMVQDGFDPKQIGVYKVVPVRLEVGKTVIEF